LWKSHKGLLKAKDQQVFGGRKLLSCREKWEKYWLILNKNLK